MTVIPLTLANAMTQQQGSDLLTLETAIQAAIGLLVSPDPASVNARLANVVSRIGDKTTADTLLKFLSDLQGGLGLSTSTAAAGPSSNSTAIGFLKLISSYLQIQTGMASVCTKAAVALSTTSAPVISSGSKLTWMITNPTNSPIYIEYGSAATVAGGHPILAQSAWLDDFHYIGLVSAIAASGTPSIDYRVFTL